MAILVRPRNVLQVVPYYFRFQLAVKPSWSLNITDSLHHRRKLAFDSGYRTQSFLSLREKLQQSWRLIFVIPRATYKEDNLLCLTSSRFTNVASSSFPVLVPMFSILRISHSTTFMCGQPRLPKKPRAPTTRTTRMLVLPGPQKPLARNDDSFQTNGMEVD